MDAREARPADPEHGDWKSWRRQSESLEANLGRDWAAVEGVVDLFVVGVEVEDVQEDGRDSAEEEGEEDESCLAGVQTVLLHEDDGNRLEEEVDNSVDEGHCKGVSESCSSAAVLRLTHCRG